MMTSAPVYEYAGGPWPTREEAMADVRTTTKGWVVVTAPEFFTANEAWYWYLTGRASRK